MKKTLLPFLFFPIIFSCGVDEESKKEKTPQCP
jgi:hypothetical protein